MLYSIYDWSKRNVLIIFDFKLIGDGGVIHEAVTVIFYS